MQLKEIIILVIVSFASLFVLGYSVHMFIGGLVSESTERWAIIITCSIGAIVIGLLIADIIKQRRQR
jgi:hypothetical protein